MSALPESFVGADLQTAYCVEPSKGTAGTMLRRRAPSTPKPKAKCRFLGTDAGACPNATLPRHAFTCPAANRAHIGNNVLVKEWA